MRIYSIVSTALSGVFMASISSAAFAGSCDNGKCGPNYYPELASYEGIPNAVCRTRFEAANAISTCSVRSIVHAAADDSLAPVNYYNYNPYGHLKTFAYKNTPNVSTMKVYARAPIMGLNYVPYEFAAGCNPLVTQACNNKAEVIIAAPAPVQAQMQVPFPVYTPTMRPAPVAPVQVHTSNAYTSGNVIGHVSGGSYTVTKPGTSDYWEKTSGATVISGMPATQVVCRRAGSAATTETVNVVRPVIGVPQPVPTPLPYCLPGQASFAPIALPMNGNPWTQ